jgi:hypothetical protein
MPSTGCAQEKVLTLKTVHNDWKLSTLGISRTTLYAKSRRDYAPPRGDAPVRRTAGHRTLYGSTVCSNAAARIARICAAIEELAGPLGEQGRVSAAGGEAAGPGPDRADDELAGRLAAIWAMIAEADPELARRLPGYLAAGD